MIPERWSEAKLLIEKHLGGDWLQNKFDESYW